MPRRGPRVSAPARRPKPKELSRRDARIRAPVTHEDLGLDEQETWHKDQDKILFDMDQGGVESEDDEEEVFALKGVGRDSDDDGAAVADEGLGPDDDDDETQAPPTSKKPTKRTRLASPTSETEESTEDETWGTKRSAYYANAADAADSSDEEELALELAEAKRLQRKVRETLDEADYGLGHWDEQEGASIETEDQPAVPAESALPKDKGELLRHLERTSPETLALAREWGDIAYRIQSVERALERYDEREDKVPLGLVHAHHQVLLTYATTLAFYLHLRAKPEHALSTNPLTSHPILKRLLELKKHLSMMENYGFAADDEDEKLGSGSDDDSLMGLDDDVWESLRARGLDDEELAELLRDAQSSGNNLKATEISLGEHTINGGPWNSWNGAPALPKKGPAVNGPDTKKGAMNGTEKKKAKSTKAVKQPKSSHYDLVQPEFKPAKRLSTARRTGLDWDAHFGDPVALNSADASDKSARKKSLRFHTSRIESAAARRDAARKSREGGDEDLPYRERHKDVQARTKPNATGDRDDVLDADLDSEEWGEPDRKRARDVMEEDALEGVYDLVSREKKRQKVEKKEAYDAGRAAQRVDPVADSDGGPRSLTRAILTNRGLTPRRNKLARNPRVKKRARFDQAKKRLGSQKAVYKGGQASLGGEYAGEKSGISKGVVKSVRF